MNTKKSKGGNIVNDVKNLSIPFGLILAQKSLEKYLDLKNSQTKKLQSTKGKKNDNDKQKRRSSTKPPKSTNIDKKRKSVVGGSPR